MLRITPWPMYFRWNGRPPRIPSWVTRKIFGMVSLLVGIPFLLGQEKPKPDSVASTFGSERTKTVEGVYRRLCASCHAADGQGKKSRNRQNIPDFTAAGWHKTRTDPQLLSSILHGQGDYMPAFDARLTREEAVDLVAFIRDFGPQQGPRTPAPQNEYERRFEELCQEFADLSKQIKALSGSRPKP